MSALRSAVREDLGAEYGVAWRGRDGTVASGSLALERGELVLRGSANGGAVKHERVPLDRIAAVRVGRAEAERVRGGRSVVLELRDGGIVPIAPLGVAGAVFELADLVAELSADAAAAAAPVVVVLPLRAGMSARARALVSSGPPFDLERAGLDRHQVFVTDHEAIFLFEGAHARERVERLLRDPHVLRHAARWRRCIAGAPRLAEESYAWRRQEAS
ncbi:MAG TPA: hypothetical protein VFW80_04155 [Gaiellaceae bacterium]|nr:hypothetical protein [Gaiellaceae bacterium]